MELICAVALNGVIGNSKTNSIPWHLPADLKHFKAITTGRTVVMGSKTHNSLGRNLPNRRNVVITKFRTPLINTPDAIYGSLFDAASYEGEDIVVIGGQSLFNEAVGEGVIVADTLHMTIIKQDADGDVCFPVTGHELLNESFTRHGVTYKAVFRSEELEENGIKFQYATFQKVE